MYEPQKRTSGRPIDHQKTKQVFNAIDTILANEGISGLSVEGIAKRAGISKATLYRRFGSLKGILSAYVETFTQEALDQALLEANVNFQDESEIKQTLIHIGTELMSLISQPRVIAFDNAMLASGPQFQTVKDVAYKSGPQKAVHFLATYLEKSGVTSDQFDSDGLGHLLFHIWRSGFYDQAKVTGVMPMSDEQLTLHITAATQFFLSCTTLRRSK